LSTRLVPSRGPPQIFLHPALLITTLVTLVFVVVSVLQLPWVLIPLGLFVLFVAPGYAVVALLFSGRPLPSMALNAALVVAFSVVFNVLLGAVLFYFAIGPVSPLVGLGVAVLCASATVIQLLRPRGVPPSAGIHLARAHLQLPGFTSGQRTAAYALFAGIVVTFGVIGYLSTLEPGRAPDLSLGVVGPDGTTNTLPTSGTVNSTLTVIVEVQNNATAQPFILSANSSIIGTNGTLWTIVPWVMPLRLAPNVTSSETLNLSSGEIDDVPVSFQFTSDGNYAVSFALTPPQTHGAVRTSSISVVIT